MKSQIIPLLLTVVTFFMLCSILFVSIHFFNFLPFSGKIFLQLRPLDVLVGLIIYLKTSIDFTLFIGNLMHHHQGIKNRIAIELGTSLGNGIGTLLILTIWIFFKEIPILLIAMVFLASVVLLRLAEESIQEFLISNFKFSTVRKIVKLLETVLHAFNKLFDPILGKLLPHSPEKRQIKKSFWVLFVFSLTIPFLLGLDDFAGYVALFSLINVFGFAVGVLLGHTILTASLFAFPNKTIHIVRQPIILLLGSVVFLGLAVWGFVEVGEKILTFV